MAVKTFTDNTSLGASDINTYLNNGGLVYITGTTGTATAAINIDNCFSATYDNYRIVISNGTTSSPQTIYFRLRASGTNSTASYYYGARYSLFVGGSADNSGSNIGFIPPGTWSTAPKSASTFDLCNPFDTVHTTIMGVATNFDAWWSFAGVHQVNTAYDGFSILPAAGTLTATVRVYGYREA